MIDIAMDKRNGDLYNAWVPVGYHAMQLPDFTARPTAQQCAKLTEVLGKMATAFLPAGGKFVAGAEEPSIADLSIIPLVHTLTLSTAMKAGYALPVRWARYYTDVSTALGKVLIDATQVHTDWVEGNLDGTSLSAPSALRRC